MIKWHCNQKPLILGILSSGNLCLRNQFYSKLLETASTASDLKCLKIQVIWDHAPSNWTIWGWQKAVMMKFKHLLENVVIFWTQPQQPPYQPLRSNLFWGHWGLFLPILDTRVIAKADLIILWYFQKQPQMTSEWPRRSNPIFCYQKKAEAIENLAVGHSSSKDVI